MRNNKRIFRDNKNAILFVTAVFVSFWIWGSKPGLGQKQEDTRFTVETHDKTSFPLVGRHRTVSCGECHLDGILEGTPAACEACHWVRRQDDRHRLRLGLHCGDCHTPFSWKNVASNIWNHLAATGYSLEGVHKTLDCVDCHGEEGFRKFVIDCFDCHEGEYSETREPDHRAAGFPTQCQLCHRNNSRWEGAAYSHTSFVLRGKHKAAECTDCHSTAQYPGLSTACVSCHSNDYNDAGDPDHKVSGFPTDCEFCHGTNAVSWEGASFNHSSIWLLQGAHTQLDCSQCHQNGYNLPRDCYGCHAPDYDSTADPVHRTAGFPTDCQICHYPTHFLWSQAVFDHEFPIDSGKHANASCTDCHVSSNYREFSCLTCHSHNKTSMDNKHEDVAGYIYQSQACYACHPRGRE